MPDKAADQSSDPTKDRFREALERKRAKNHASNGEAQNDSKVHGTHDRAGAKRTFRRKSGG
jgi:hypothetical protein